MSGATLASLQGALTEIYDLPVTPDVRDFLMTDRAGLARRGRPARERRAAASSRRRATRCRWRCTSTPPCSSGSSVAIRSPGSRSDNLADYLTVAEGVSHFVYVAWNTGYDKPVTLLELELQAEVDKYVLCAWLLREQGAGRFPRELHRALFERARVDPVAAAGRIGLYHTASDYAARFCRRVAALLERKRAWRRRATCWPSCAGSIAGGTCARLRHIERFAVKR